MKLINIFSTILISTQNPQGCFRSSDSEKMADLGGGLIALAAIGFITSVFFCRGEFRSNRRDYCLGAALCGFSTWGAVVGAHLVNESQFICTF